MNPNWTCMKTVNTKALIVGASSCFKHSWTYICCWKNQDSHHINHIRGFSCLDISAAAPPVVFSHHGPHRNVVEHPPQLIFKSAEGWVDLLGVISRGVTQIPIIIVKPHVKPEKNCWWFINPAKKPPVDILHINWVQDFLHQQYNPKPLDMLLMIHDS